MIEIDGKKLSQEDVNSLLIQACHDGNLIKVVKCVEAYDANVNCTDSLGYAKALVYALRSCMGKDSEGELIVKYLVNRGAEINFKHGDKGSNMDSRAYFIYHAANDTMHVSDDLVYFLVKKGAVSTLDYVPITKRANANISALEEIRHNRPSLYDRLLKERLISSKNRK